MMRIGQSFPIYQRGPYDDDYKNDVHTSGVGIRGTRRTGIRGLVSFSHVEPERGFWLLPRLAFGMAPAKGAGGSDAKMPPKKTQVFVVCVIRREDEVVVASFSVSSQQYTSEDVVDLVSEKSARMEVGKKYTDMVDEALSVHFQLDAKGRVFAIMTTTRYSPRVAFAALAELSKSFAEQFGPSVKGATAGSLSKASKPLLKGVIDRWGDPEKGADALTKVQAKLDQATDTMRENIEVAVKNTKMIEDIEDQSESVLQKSKEFQSNASKLKNKMWWKKVKTYLLIGGLIISVLLIIIVPVAVQASAASSAASAAGGGAGPAPAPAPAPQPASSAAPTLKPAPTARPRARRRRL